MKFIFGADTVPTKFNISYFENGEIDKIIDTGIKDIIDKADYHIFNLETPLSDGGAPIKKRGPNLIASKKCINGMISVPHKNQILLFNKGGIMLWQKCRPYFSRSYWRLRGFCVVANQGLAFFGVCNLGCAHFLFLWRLKLCFLVTSERKSRLLQKLYS